MPNTKVKGIITQSKDSKEKDRSVVIYTLESGKVRATFRGVRGEKAKMKASKNIFTFGDFFIENTKAGNIVTGVDVIETFFPLSENLDKYYEACSVLDVVKKLGTEESDPQFFLETVKALKAICYGDLKRNYVLNRFILRVFEGAGYPITLEKCASCKSKITGKKFINYEFGEVVCGGCKTYTCEELSPIISSAIKIFNNTDYDKLSTIRLSENAENEALKILLKNFVARFGVEIFSVL